MRLGISTYSYTWAFGVPGDLPKKLMVGKDLINKAIELNIPCVQIADNFPLHLLSEKELILLADYSKENNMEHLLLNESFKTIELNQIKPKSPQYLCISRKLK